MSSLYKYKKIEDIPNKISIFPLNGALLLPRSQLPLNIFEPRYAYFYFDFPTGSSMLNDQCAVWPLDVAEVMKVSHVNSFLQKIKFRKF